MSHTTTNLLTQLGHCHNVTWEVEGMSPTLDFSTSSTGRLPQFQRDLGGGYELYNNLLHLKTNWETARVMWKVEGMIISLDYH